MKKPTQKKPSCPTLVDVATAAHNAGIIAGIALVTRALAEMNAADPAGRRFHWVFASNRGHESYNPFYLIFSRGRNQGHSGIQLVTHVFSGTAEAVALYSTAFCSVAETAREEQKTSTPVAASKKEAAKTKVRRKKRRLTLAPVSAQETEFVFGADAVRRAEAASTPSSGQKFKVGQKIGSGGQVRTIVKALRHGSGPSGWKYRMDDDSVWTQAQLSAVLEP